MIKILITTKPDSQAPITGSVVALYGEPGVCENALRPLINVDFKGAILTDRQKEFIIQRLPLRFDTGYKDAWGTDRLSIIIEEYPVEFEADFWKPYGNKVNKERCMKIWDKMKPNVRTEAVNGLSAYLRHLARLQWKNQANPQTYLTEKYWKTDWDNLNS